MTTAEKRMHIEKRNYPLFDKTLLNIENQDFRQIDNDMQEETDTAILQYVITLLCDELVRHTNDNTGE